MGFPFLVLIILENHEGKIGYLIFLSIGICSISCKEIHTNSLVQLMGHAHLGLSKLQLEVGNSWKHLAIVGM